MRFAFRRAPSSYDEHFMETMASEYVNQTPWTRLRLAAVADLVEPRAGERILDLGCAAGAITHFLSTFGCESIGIDAEPVAIETAQGLFPDLEFRVADAANLPFESESFDKAVAADFVEHLDDETFRGVLVEVRRVLRPGGRLAIYTPNPRHVIERLKERNLILAQNPTHIGLRDAPSIAALLKATGFAIERDEWRPSFFRGLRTIERIGGRVTSALRYRLCLSAAKA